MSFAEKETWKVQVIIKFNLKEIIKFKYQEGLKEKLALRLFRQISSALAYLHSLEIAHCDLKLENILVDRELSQTKLIDFGLSVQKKSRIEDFCMGTPSFMSPQLLKKEGFSPYKADVWAMGVLLYKLIFGVLPFKAKTAEQIVKKIFKIGLKFPRSRRISAHVKEGIEKMIVIKERDRFTSEQVEEWFKVKSNA